MFGELGAHPVESLWIVVPDVRPAPQGSKSKGRSGHLYESSKYVKPYREVIAAAAKLKMAEKPGTIWPLTLSVAVKVSFFFERPKKPTHTYPKANGDTDKLQRAVGDALQIAGVVADDNQISQWDASKRYGTRNLTTILVVSYV